jgi:hypothetical protein
MTDYVIAPLRSWVKGGRSSSLLQRRLGWMTDRARDRGGTLFGAHPPSLSFSRLIPPHVYSQFFPCAFLENELCCNCRLRNHHPHTMFVSVGQNFFLYSE